VKHIERVHRWIDGEEPAPAPGTDGAEVYREYERVLSDLAEHPVKAPGEFVTRVMEALPPEPDRGWLDRVRRLWPGGGRWLIPAAAGALAVWWVAVGIPRLQEGREGVPVTFEIHAPEAQRVELVGSFNDWRPGEIVLQGPDATGHWRATVRLPPGRHEYLFLVDGRKWVVDPGALARRPDGFGRENAVIEL